MSGTLGHSGGARPGRAGRKASRFILELNDNVKLTDNLGNAVHGVVVSVKPELKIQCVGDKYVIIALNAKS